MAALLRHISKTQKNSIFLHNITTTFNTISSSSLQQTPFILPTLSQVRLIGNAAAESVCGFDEMVKGNDRKYYMLGGKGGVGKTSCAASLAVKFANHGHPTVVVSTDPAHSLSDSFAQDLTGGNLVPVEGVSSPLYALEINPDKSMDEFRTVSQKLGGGGAKSLMQSIGFGAVADQLGDLKLEELLQTPPPGTDEIIAITKVMQFLETEEYSKFSRIVFDTAPTGHTLGLLALPEFLDGSVGKLIKMKAKLGSVFNSLLGKEQSQNNPLDKLEKLKESVAKIHDLFHNSDTTEFIIVTIPTIMAIKESSRLHASLKKESVPVKRLIINQVLPPTSDCKFCSMKIKDQTRAIETIRNDSELSGLRLCQAPLVDTEIRGVPALKFMGDKLWR